MLKGSLSRLAASPPPPRPWHQNSKQSIPPEGSQAKGGVCAWGRGGEGLTAAVRPGLDLSPLTVSRKISLRTLPCDGVSAFIGTGRALSCFACHASARSAQEAKPRRLTVVDISPLIFSCLVTTPSNGSTTARIQRCPVPFPFNTEKSGNLETFRRSQKGTLDEAGQRSPGLHKHFPPIRVSRAPRTSQNMKQEIATECCVGLIRAFGKLHQEFVVTPILEDKLAEEIAKRCVFLPSHLV